MPFVICSCSLAQNKLIGLGHFWRDGEERSIIPIRQVTQTVCKD